MNISYSVNISNRVLQPQTEDMVKLQSEAVVMLYGLSVKKHLINNTSKFASMSKVWKEYVCNVDYKHHQKVI